MQSHKTSWVSCFTCCNTKKIEHTEIKFISLMSVCNTSLFARTTEIHPGKVPRYSLKIPVLDQCVNGGHLGNLLRYIEFHVGSKTSY